MDDPDNIMLNGSTKGIITSALKRAGSKEWYRQEDFVQEMRENYERVKKRNGSPLLLKVLTIEVKGGVCPICGEPYIKKRKYDDGLIKRDYEYFKAPCNCIENHLYPEKLTQEEVDYFKMGIPAKYYNVDFDSWDSGNAEELNYAKNIIYKYTEKDSRGFDEWKSLRGRGALLHGPTGRGKTHCGIALLKHIAKTSKLKIKFQQCANIQDRIFNFKGSYHEHILSHDVIMLDDFDKANFKNDFVRNEFFSIIDGAINDMKIVILTTNIGTGEEMKNLFGDAIASRLLGFKIVSFVEGEDYRLKEAFLRSQKEQV